MKIEIKLALNNMKKNKKRTIFNILSIALCSCLIFTTILIITSIRESIKEKVNTAYKDFHFIIKDISIDDFDKLKTKKYIDKIYIKEDGKETLKQVDASYNPSNNNLNVYIKYINAKDSYKNSSDIIQTLNFSRSIAEEKCEFNDKVLTVYGLVGAKLDDSQGVPTYKSNLDFSFVINIMIILIFIVFSILFIIILYNAFLITINERKREYAILNSIGGTEGQILKIIFIEATIIGLVGIVFGYCISILGTNVILNMLNKILIATSYNFKLIIDIKYIILSLIIILFNIYISAIIPSVRASNISIIQSIRENKQIKYKKRNSMFKKFFPIECRLALINLKRNKNKYRIITFLFVISMLSYITISTYIKYEEEASSFITEYDVDAELSFDLTSNIDYKSILNNYVTNSNDEIECIEYKRMGLYVLVEPEIALKTDNLVTTYEDNKKSLQMLLIGLDSKKYNEYINKLNANYGDYIIYNMTVISGGESETTYTYEPIFNTDKLNLSIIESIYNYENNSYEYKIINNEKFKNNFILTDDLIEGYKEIRTMFKVPTIFVDMDTYDSINSELNSYSTQSNDGLTNWSGSDLNSMHVKINCENIISLSNYIENLKKVYNLNIISDYYSLDNQERIIYINVLQLILKIVIIIIGMIGIISAINIINASLCEREQEFKILTNLGATKGNINCILIYECIYMFIKATIISTILSIPIIYAIIKSMENVVILDELLIPFGNILLFFILLFIISLFITLYSSRNIKANK